MSKKTLSQRREGVTAEYCCVPLCGATSRNNAAVSFHAFPSDQELRLAWVSSIGRHNLFIRYNTRVCSRHFAPEDITDRKDCGGRRILRRGALPVLFHWNNYSLGGPLLPVKGNLNASADQDILDNAMLPTVWTQFREEPFLFQHDCVPVHKASSIKTRLDEFSVEELDWPTQSPDLSFIQHLWDELEQKLRARLSHPTSVPDSILKWGEHDALKPLVLESEEEIISVLTASHVSEGGYHHDIQQTKDIISARYYWPNMSNRIKTWIDECKQCVKMDNGSSGGTCDPTSLDRAPHKASIEAKVPESSPVSREAQDIESKALISTDFKKQGVSSGCCLQCPYCYFQCNTKCSFQIHVGSQHPLHCEDMSVGRLGKVVFYQRTARLFHCYICFFTSKDYTKLFDHLLIKHCFSGKASRKDEASGLKHKTEEAKEGCSASDREGNEQDKTRSPKVQNHLIDLDAKTSITEDPLKTLEAQSMERQVSNGSNEDSTFSSSSLKRKRSSASCSEDDDDEEEDEDELDSSQAAKEEKNAAVTKYTEHLSTRYYYCKFCKWRSKKKGFLLYHVSQKHDVPKPHACKECNKTFMLETLLTKHVNMFHKQGLYQCPFCPFESNYLRGIRRHLNNCRGEEEGEAASPTLREEKE